jgi:hypothetical protein
VLVKEELVVAIFDRKSETEKTQLTETKFPEMKPTFIHRRSLIDGRFMEREDVAPEVCKDVQMALENDV